MKKIQSLDEQLEILAEKWYVNLYPKEERRMARKEFQQDKNSCIEEYLVSHKKIAREYQEKKALLKKVKYLFVAGSISIATIVGAMYHLSTKGKDSNGTQVQIEQETEKNTEELEIESKLSNNIEEKQENSFATFFEEVRDTDSTEQRDTIITNKTKEVIVQMYKNKYPESSITKEQLKILLSSQYVVQTKDKLGNYTYERVPQDVPKNLEANQQWVRLSSGIYIFEIEGKTVATYDGNGYSLKDDTIEKHESIFENAIPMLKISEKLKDIYEFPSNDNEKAKLEKQYQEEAERTMKLYSKSREKVEEREIER